MAIFNKEKLKNLQKRTIDEEDIKIIKQEISKVVDIYNKDHKDEINKLITDYYYDVYDIVDIDDDDDIDEDDLKHLKKSIENKKKRLKIPQNIKLHCIEDKSLRKENSCVFEIVDGHQYVRDALHPIIKKIGIEAKKNINIPKLKFSYGDEDEGCIYIDI